MPVEVILPKVDMDMAIGRISRWFYDNDAVVKKGDVLFEIETDKAAMEIDAPASGILRDIGREGVDIPVGAPVAWIYEEGETYTGSPVPAKAGPTPPRPSSEIMATSPASSTPKKLPLVAGNTAKIRATPLARRLAQDSGIDLVDVVGTGPKGRVSRSDILSYRSTESASTDIGLTAATSGTVPGAVSDVQVRNLFAEESYAVIAHSNMRRTIARRLVEAKSTIPHFYLTLDCNIDALLRLRAELNASSPIVDGKAEYKLSINDMVIKAYAMALRAVPDANVSWIDEGLLKHRHADIGVAVSVPGGLITPIVRSAEIKTLSAISNEMKDLGARAREGKLKTDEYQGGTATVSNLGMFGIREFAAIVNPPHATILAVGAGERRPILAGNDITAATMTTVTLSTDHRAVDGALGAELLGAFRSCIERPMLMLV